MRKILALLASAALMTFTLAAHADTLFSISNGTTDQGGTYSGFFSLNTATDTIDGGSFVLLLNGASETFTYTSGTGKTGPYTTGIYASGADQFGLVTTSSTSSPVLCSSANFGTCSIVTSYFRIQGQNRNISLTGGTIGPYTPDVAPTPEPSSLILLGTGVLGLAGAARRRFLKA